MDGFCGEKEKFAAVFCKKFVERVIIGDVEQMPVIETGALKLFVVDLKAHGAHKVQPCARGGAGARDVAGVLGDLRLDHNDI